MYADVTPIQVELMPEGTATLTVRISNPSTTIDAYDISLFGLDPSWVRVEPRRLSLFPSETDEVLVTISLPPDFPAGHRVLSIHVQSENDPTDFALVQASMLVVEQPRLTLRMDPVLVSGGHTATFGMVVTNTGNSVVHGTPDCVDPEEQAKISFTPEVLDLAPGQREVVQARVTARRPWVGSPKVRTFTFAVDAHNRSEAVASFVQKPRLGRLMFAMLGLLTAAAVFAVVLSKTFDNVVDEASVDDASLAAALDQGAGDGSGRAPVDPGVVTGTVTLFSTDAGIGGVQADLFGADNTEVPIATAATNDAGEFGFPRLSAGSYVLKLSGAGFAEVWYPAAPTAADAEAFDVELGKAVELDAVQLGGRPGNVKGVVKVADPTGAIATLVVPGVVSDTPASVKAVEVSADGTFVFEAVPSPAEYQLIVEKPGYAPSTRDVVVGPAETVEGIEIVLRKGDGVIRGSVQGDGVPLGGATIVATDGTTQITTVSLTDGSVGSFSLRALPTPATYTLTVSKDGYTTETRTIALTTGQQVDQIAIALTGATGSMSGTTTLQGAAGLGGVTVTVSGGATEVTTTTVSSGAVGTWFIDDLPIPATYTVTFAEEGLVSQVRLIDLDPLAGSVDAVGVDVEMSRDHAVVTGIVRGSDGNPVALATAELSDGTITRRLVTAHDPLGRFTFDDVPPGAYTLTASLPGTTPAVVLVNVTAGELNELDLRLDAQASLAGRVTLFDATSATYQPLAGATVRLYPTESFPGPASAALASVVTDASGAFTFTSLDAPDDFVIAVYATASSPDPVDSRLVLTQPSAQVVVPTFQLLELF